MLSWMNVTMDELGACLSTYVLPMFIATLLFML